VGPCVLVGVGVAEGVAVGVSVAVGVVDGVGEAVGVPTVGVGLEGQNTTATSSTYMDVMPASPSLNTPK